MNSISLAGVDVGSPGLKGRTKQSGNDLEIVAGGADIWGLRDEFHFAQMRISGDFEIGVRLLSLTMGDLYTKAGIMFRASLEDGAEHAYLLAFGDNQPRNSNNGGLEFQFRPKANDTSIGVYPPQPLPPKPDFPVDFPNVWLKMIRSGTRFTCENSLDGKNWKTFCVHEQGMPAAGHLGLALTSHNPKQTVKLRALLCGE